MAIQYKKKCRKCNKNYVLANSRQFYVVCHDCQKAEMQGEIKDPKMKRMFAIPEKYYEKEAFLRSIKVNYLKYESLSEKQIEAFKKVVKKLKDAEE